jgi:SRSO17 transposase
MILVRNEIAVPGGAFIFDDTDIAKRGKNIVGVSPMYNGREGRTTSSQAFQVISYTDPDTNNYAILSSTLYLSKSWFEDDHKELWVKDRIPEDTTYKYKNVIGAEMLTNIFQDGKFPAKWVLFDAFMGHDTHFVDKIPEKLYYYGSVHSTDKFFPEMPVYSVPEKASGRGRKPTNVVPSVKPQSVAEIVNKSQIPWRQVEFGLGTNGPLRWEEKLIRVLEIRDGKPRNWVWLYAKKFDNGTIKYQISNAPKDTPLHEIRQISTTRWNIEQNFKESKSELGMTEFEGRTWDGSFRHMLFVRMVNFFLFIMRKVFSVSVDELSENGKMVHQYLFDRGQEMTVKDGPLSSSYRQKLQANILQNQGKGQDQHRVQDKTKDEDQNQGQDQGKSQDQGQSKSQDQSQDKNQGKGQDQEQGQDKNQSKGQDQDQDQEQEQGQDKNQDQGKSQNQGQDQDQSTRAKTKARAKTKTKAKARIRTKAKAKAKAMTRTKAKAMTRTKAKTRIKALMKAH